MGDEMSFEYFDYRTDLRNVFVSPELRCRFMRIEADQTTGSHTHDLGHEVFMVMEGRIEFDFDGETAILGPGQMCVAKRDVPHTLKALDGNPAVIYLSVTPHVEPTHTSWDESGSKRPPRYGVVREGWTDGEPPVAEHLAAVQALAEAVQAQAARAEAASATLRRALEDGDRNAAKAAVDAMWAQLCQTHLRLVEVDELWNQLGPRVSPPD
jgi:quercetin dioxygenase-like cupin family protein